VSEDNIRKKENNLKNQNTPYDAQNVQTVGLTRDLGDLGFRPAWVSKVIGKKHKKYVMLIFNSKAKILIKTLK